MSEKFTQEPWEISDMSGVDACDNVTVCFHVGRSDTKELIAELQSDDEKDYEHVKANARLIKAAPIMYDMLNSLLNSNVYHLDELTRDNIRYELRKIKCE
jgi:hypothetical protein